MDIDFGKTASDYATYRVGYPDTLFSRLKAYGIGLPNQTILDIGTGTGYLARPLAKQGAILTGLDRSSSLLSKAQQLDQEQGVSIRYLQGAAEQLPFSDASFDIVTAAQCWHWFQRDLVALDTFRVLKIGGKIAIVHLDWLPFRDNVVFVTEQLILQYNPHWSLAGGDGFHVPWLSDLIDVGYQHIETFSYDLNILYSHESWRGRIRASAGVGASLPAEKVASFDHDLQKILDKSYSSPLSIPHRLFVVMGTK